MKTTFLRSFVKDLKAHEREKKLLDRVQEVILEVEAAETILAIKNLKKLKAKGSYYRIRLGNYRIGLIIESETVTFVRFLHRRDIYRYFP